MKRAECTVTSFKELKDVLERKPHTLRSGAATKVHIPDCKTDEDIFLEAMADVREIREFRNIPIKKPPRIEPRRACVEDVREALREIVEGKRGIRLSDTGEYMEWTGSHTRKDITKKLHEGRFAVQDSIDLHGMTLREADEALIRFFRDAVKRRLFCIKVIHGRGLRSPKGPVIKEALKQWLHGPLRKWVMAYASAKDCDGGLGATYIMLK